MSESRKTMIFLAPAQDSGSRKHLQDTIRTPVPLSYLSGLSPQTIETLKSTGKSEFPMWGCTNSKVMRTSWEQIQPGDWVVFYTEDLFRIIGQVVTKEDNSKVAAELWPDGSWPLLFFLQKAVKIAVPKEVVFKAVDYKGNYILRGFTPVKTNLASSFESVESLVDFLLAGGGDAQELLDSAFKEFEADSAGESGQEPELGSVLAAAKLEEAGIALTTDGISVGLADKDGGTPDPEKRKRVSDIYERSRKLAKKLKTTYDGKCQVCGFTFAKSDGSNYAEAAHWVALQHGGGDILQNLLCLCANHHKMLDHGLLEICFADGALKANWSKSRGLLESGELEPITNKHIMSL